MDNMQTSDWDKASDTLKKNISAMPLGQTSKIRDIIGPEFIE